MNLKPGAEFPIGRIVRVKSNPSIRGVIIEVLQVEPEARYKVFVEGEVRTYYASQLELETGDESPELVTRDEFHANLTALLIKSPAQSTLYSLNSARIDFIPYQFRPVLKFINSDRPRLLIADSVGVGKTIEAGLILRELQARRDIRSILIICPRPLVTERKWLNEMKRFEERFVHLDGPTLRYCINEMDLEGVWPEQYQRIIVPYSLFDETLLYGSGGNGRGKRSKGLYDLNPPPRFDLVIVDEAHHIRNRDTFNYRAVRFFCDNAEAAIFLTATPIQLGSHDLFVLLNTLRPDLVIDWESFEHMAEPNPHINQAIMWIRTKKVDNWQSRAGEALDRAAATEWGRAILCHNPEFARIRSKIMNETINDEERVELISILEGLHTFNGIINRTRRRDIGDFTVRKPETVRVPFTPEQQRLHDQILNIQAEILSRLHGDVNVRFMMTTIRRQAASCLYGLAPLLEEILNRHIDELSLVEADNMATLPPYETVDAIQSQIRSILSLTETLDPKDPKLDALRKIIRDKQKLPNKKLMVFSSFRHTLNYLYQHLKADGFRVGLIHGDTPDEDRLHLRNLFEKPPEDEDSLDILLFSEIGCEGLDYQFCDCIVNYDLPWNPMRIEQRIGRIDRQGQKSESIAIINFITPGTIDADIYEKCLLRIGIFEHALGDNEEILGEITREIRDIAEKFGLSEEERRAKLQQLADNKIRLIREQEALEERQAELFGIQIPAQMLRKEIEDSSSYWLSPPSIQRLVERYLRSISGSEQGLILGEKKLKTLRLSQELRNRLLADFQRLPQSKSITYKEWEKWLRGGHPYLTITFESDCAKQHPEVVFITPVHPLTKQAALAVFKSKRVITALKATSDEIPPGKYEFAIYQWRYYGIREDLVIQPISSSQLVTSRLSELLENAEMAQVEEEDLSDLSKWEKLDLYHYEIWARARELHRERTKELVKFRKESLTKSHQARIALLTDQLNQATDERIKRMRRSQLESAESDYARRIQEIEIATERVDIIAEPVAFGIIYTERSQT